MILTADRIVVRGRARAHFGLDVSPQGKVLAVAPLRHLPRPTHVFAGKVLLPGLVDVHAGDLAYDTAIDASIARYSARLESGFRARQAYGITTVGVPHRSLWGPAPAGEQFAVANTMLAAARATGMRLAVLDVMNPQGVVCTSAHLEGAMARFDALVHHILTTQDPQVSWALLAAGQPAMPLDALMVLRVRLGHLPCLWMAADAEAASQISLLAARGIMDAGFTVLDDFGLTAAQSALVAHHGARHALTARAWAQGGHDDKPPGDNLRALWDQPQAHLAHFCEAAGPSAPWHALSGGGAWPPEASQALVRLRAATVGGTTALGLKGGALAPGHWADFFAVPSDDLGLDPVKPFGPEPEAGWVVAHMVQATAPNVSDLFVAGRRWL